MINIKTTYKVNSSTSDIINNYGSSISEIKYTDYPLDAISGFKHDTSVIGTNIDVFIAYLKTQYLNLKSVQSVDASIMYTTTTKGNAPSVDSTNFINHYSELSSLPDNVYRITKIDFYGRVILTSNSGAPTIEGSGLVKNGQGLGSSINISETKNYHFNKLTRIITAVDTNDADASDDSHYCITIVNKCQNFGPTISYTYIPRDPHTTTGETVSFKLVDVELLNGSTGTVQYVHRTVHNDTIETMPSSGNPFGLYNNDYGNGIMKVAKNELSDCDPVFDLIITGYDHFVQAEIYSRL